MNLTNASVQHNKNHHRFELKLENQTAFVEYQTIDEETLVLTHTEVPAELEGQGIGSALVKGVLEQVERDKLMIVPACPFVKAYIQRHPEWNRVVTRSYELDGF
jgi:uncharacterized protein